MTENWDVQPNNVLETSGLLDRQPFTFSYGRFEVWKDGKLIDSGFSKNRVIATIENRYLIVKIEDQKINNHINSFFKFPEISATGNRILWSKDLQNKRGLPEKNTPDLCSLFYRNSKLTKVTFTIFNPNILVEYYQQKNDITTDVDYIAFGIEELKSNDYMSAIESFTKALEINPKNVYAHFHRAQTHQLAGNLTNSIIDLHNAMGLDILKTNELIQKYY